MSQTKRTYENYNRAEFKRELLFDSRHTIADINPPQMVTGACSQESSGVRNPNLKSDWEAFWYDFFDMDLKMDGRR